VIRGNLRPPERRSTPTSRRPARSSLWKENERRWERKLVCTHPIGVLWLVGRGELRDVRKKARYRVLKGSGPWRFQTVGSW